MGFATVSALAARGMMVAAISRDAGRLHEAVLALDDDARSRVITIPADVSSEDQVIAAVDEVVSTLGRIDVLVNCAGVSMSARRSFESTTTEEWRRLIDINLTGTYLMCRTVLPHLKAKGGYILNVLSTAAFRVPPGSGIYAASKFGARALTEALIDEFRDSGIRTTSVSPGATNTTIWDHKIEPPDESKRALMIQPGDIAEIFTWLLDRPARLHIPDINVTPWTAA
jgi:NAD(P)-dependent dehydrogenase (short-subunit alcohol dehydrogenase family)